MHTDPLLEPTCLCTCENEEDGRSYRRNPLQHHCALPIGCPCIMCNCRVVPTLQLIFRKAQTRFSTRQSSGNAADNAVGWLWMFYQVR